MNMSKKIYAVIAVVIVVCLGFFLSHQGAEEETRLNVMFGGVGYEFEAINKQIDVWKEASGENVQVNAAVRGTDSRLQQYLPHLQTSAMDIYQVDVGWAPMIADVMEDLHDHFTKEELAVFHPGLLRAGTVNGKLVFLPLYVQWLRLYVRTDLLDKYQLPMPKTWEDIQKCSAIVMDKENALRSDKSPFWGIVFMGQPYEGAACILLSAMASHTKGHNIFDASGDLAVNSEGNAHAWSMIYSWLNGDANYPPIVQKGVLSYTQESARQAFQRGDALFMLNWPYAEELLDAPDSPVKGKFIVVELPAQKGMESSPVLGGAAVAVSVYSQHKKEAVNLLKHLLSFEEQRMRAERYNYISGRHDVLIDEQLAKKRPCMKSYARAWGNAIARPASRFKKWSAAGFKLGSSAHTYWQGKSPDPVPFLKQLHSELSNMLV